MAGTRTEPSGMRSDAYALENVPPEKVTEIRCPVVPSKVQVGFCPGPFVVSLTASPPAVSAALTSPTVTCAEMEPTAVPVGSSTTV